MTRVICCGGRDFRDAEVVRAALYSIIFPPGYPDTPEVDPRTITIVHGDAQGADAMADCVAQLLGMHVERHPADWSKGRAAGPLRNQALADSGADLVFAFPGNVGTEDMIVRARKAGIPVRRVP